MTMDINKCLWGRMDAFGETAPFQIKTTDSSIDAIRLIGDDETVPYITRTDTNNGVSRFVSTENYNFGSDAGGCITVGLDTQTVFYQPHKFVTGQNIQIVTGSALSEDVAQFILTVLRDQMDAKFNWGGNGATLSRMNRLSMMLPITTDGEPDWDYMSEYVCVHRESMLKRYRTYLNDIIDELGEYKEIPELEKKEWRSFNLDNIFIVKSGYRLETRNKKPGKRPFIGATESRNGVTGFVSNDNPSKDSNVLGVNYNGKPCIAFYHPYECIFTDDVKRYHLRSYPDGKYVLLFFATVIAKKRTKFSYGYKFKKERMIQQKLVLPINDVNEPDYEYMEQYAKNMMLRKYEQYLRFLEKHHPEKNY